MRRPALRPDRSLWPRRWCKRWREPASDPVRNVFGELVSADDVFAPDAVSVDGFTDQVGDGIALLVVQFEALAQGGVGQGLAGQVPSLN